MYDDQTMDLNNHPICFNRIGTELDFIKKRMLTALDFSLLPSLQKNVEGWFESRNKVLGIIRYRIRNRIRVIVTIWIFPVFG